jgi:hypothetical protein
MSNYLATNVHVHLPAHRGRPEFVLKSVNSFRTSKSWQNLTDTAEFIIAKALFTDQKRRIFEAIKPGDPFYIDAGYNGDYNREFTGFIAEVLDDMPVLFKGEDNMYILKRTKVHTSFPKGVKLAELLKKVLSHAPASNYKFEISAMDVQLGSFVFKNYTVAQVLTELKDNYGLYSYFVDNTLVVGRIYEDNPRKQVVKYTFGKNVITNNLKYHRKEDYQIKVTMTSHLTNGKKKKVTVGDPDGVEQKLVCTRVEDEATLRKLAEKELARLRFDGYRGTLTGFGIPFVDHGYTVTIKHPLNHDRDGSYYVDAVDTTFNDHGAIRRTSKIGPKAVHQ